MSSEKFPARDLEPAPLCFADIATVELDAQLNTIGIRGSAEVLDILCEEEPRPLDLSLCVQKTQEKVQKTMPDIENKAALRGKTGVTSGLYARYPEQVFEENSEELGALETPKGYTKRHGLKSSMRPRLRETRDQVCSDSRAHIIAEIAEDTSHTNYPINLSDEGLREVVLYKRSITAQEVVDSVRKIQELLPAHEPDLDRPSGTAVLFSDIVGLTNDQPWVDVPESNKEKAQVQSAFYKLKMALLSYKNQNERTIAQEICDDLEPQIEESMSQYLNGVYAEIILEEARSLNAQLIEAYSETSRIRVERPSTIEETTKKVKTRPALDPKLIELDAEDTKIEAKPQTFETANLGKIDVDFNWVAETSVDISLVKQNGHQMLVIDRAFSESAKEISKKARQRETDANKQFDNIWDQIIGIELTDPRATHSYISKVRDACNPAYEDLSILYYGNHGGAAKRTYYVKTHAGRFEAIEKFAAENGLGSDTPVAIRICETDKPSQKETYRKEFHITRAQARGVGST